ncbi:hypothetical protein [Planomonospora venezuelensis]|uniref:SAF domain-containing protein n=1 Tax=Planomonospora venezuelensis TaxID=1999 RepID=A0A841CY32_PLAVE|nr:hypothetical protein [Planomonospora venezuelensis]MBB5962209.1 hypothetical protein [Planomonospora venezuelensis]GIN00975.1 hypothetical protein Pve01_26330 [Planomonospora venezuelensis]
MRTSEKPTGRVPVNAERPGPASTLSGPASRKLPVSPRERKPALAALALLLILGGALTTTLLVLRSGDRVSAIQIVRQVGSGQKVPPEAVREVQIADTGIDYVPFSQHRSLTDKDNDHYAMVTLLPGTLLIEGMIVSSDRMNSGKAQVGLSLKPGQTPGTLEVGDRVQVIHVPGRSAGDQGRVLAENAQVDRVGGGGRTGSSGQVTVLVDSSIAPTVAAYASNGEIALTELPGAR